MNVACYQLVMPSMIHFFALFLLFSSPPCFAISPPHLVALGTAYLDSGAPMAVCAVDAASGKVTKVADLEKPESVGSGLPACFGLLPNSDAAALCTLRGGDDCIAIVSTLNGSTLAMHCTSVIVISNLVVDDSTGQVFFNGFNQTNQKNYVYELHLNSGSMNIVAHVPGIVQVCINAYSSKTKTFFLTSETDDRTGNKIVSVHIPSGKVTEIFTPAAIEILVVDPSSDNLLTWSADSTYAALLQEINATTGKTSSIFTKSLDLSANGGSAVVASDGLVYSMLLDYTQDNQPYWVVYDPKYPGSNTSVSMPEQDWACNWLLGIAQNPGSL